MRQEVTRFLRTASQIFDEINSIHFRGRLPPQNFRILPDEHCRSGGRSAGVGGGTCSRTLAQFLGPAARWIGCDDAATSGLYRPGVREDFRLPSDRLTPPRSL